MSGTRLLDDKSLLPLLITLPLPNYKSVSDTDVERLVGQEVELSDGTHEPRTAHIGQATLLEDGLVGLVLVDGPTHP